MALFATSHGKSACDGIGGVVKKVTAKARLQRPFENQVFNSSGHVYILQRKFGRKN